MDSSVPFVIHLINDLNVVHDDVITVHRSIVDNAYNVTFSDQNNGSPVKHRMTGLSRMAVQNYLFRILKNQVIDEQGYKYIQITTPAMPRVLVSGSKMREEYYREEIEEVIGISLEMLGEVRKKKNVSESRFDDESVKRHLIFGDEEL